MTTQAPTIIDLKTSFLRSQIILLSQPFQPSSSFLTSNTSNEENSLRQKAIDDALHKLNGRLKQHNNLVYGPQAKRHVAEQVDRLYFNAAERGVEILGVGEEWGDRGVDYREDSIIEQLPEEWSEEAKEKDPEQAQRYKDLQQKLVGLNERRRVARERLESSKRVMGLLNPFDKEGGLQENLVVKNGEMEEELERMRRLMLRYERARDGAGEGSRSGEDGDTDVDMEGAEEKKILTLLSAT